MKNTGKKSKVVLGIAAALCCVSLVGVGYSAFTLIASAVSDTANVSVNAPEVVENSVGVTVTQPASNYVFGPTKDATSGYLNDDGTEEDQENLTISFSLALTFSESDTSSYTFTIQLDGTNTCDDSGTVGNSGTTCLQYAIDQGYIVAPITPGTSYTLFTTTLSDDSRTVTAGSNLGSNITVTGSNLSSTAATVTVEATFAWGTSFGSANPTGATSESVAKTYKTYLDWMNSALEGDKFVYTINGAVSS